jgi:hypothetical protein
LALAPAVAIGRSVDTVRGYNNYSRPISCQARRKLTIDQYRVLQRGKHRLSLKLVDFSLSLHHCQ